MATLTDLLFILDDLWVNPNWLYPVLQLGTLAVFIGAAWNARRRSNQRLLELLSAVVFGLVLEEADIIIFKTYHYDPHWFALDLVPPAIALCWAMIIASAMNISDSLGIDERWAPFADAMWVALLDLALDPIAIRLGLWKWTIPLDKDWFGVPFGNYFAWIWVATAFSYFTRVVRRRLARQTAAQGERSSYLQLIVPLPAYGGLLAGVSPYAFLQAVYFTQVGSDWILISIAFAVWGTLTLRALLASGRVPREPPDAYLLSIRPMMQLYFLWALLATWMFLGLPILLLTSLAILGLEFALAVLILRHHPVSPRVLAWAYLILNRRSRE